MEYNHVLVDKKDHIALITLNRPKQLNALNAALMHELSHAVADSDADETIHVIVLTGNDKAFAAGADIAAMADVSYQEALLRDYIGKQWRAMQQVRKPVIAAVRGYALGGGNELAMMCDIIIAGKSAKFGQPEVKIGTIPGLGGTQRLTRAAGKAKAMAWCLTGALFSADDAERAGIVTEVVDDEVVLLHALKIAGIIAAQSLPVVLLAKMAVNRTFEISLEEGLLFEQQLFHSTFALDDQKEGMQAFLDKRDPVFKHR